MINGGLGRHTLKLSRTHLNTHAHTLSYFLTLSFDSFLCALCVRLDLSFCHSVSVRLSTTDGFSHVWKLYHILYCTSRHTLYFLLYNVSVIWWFRIAFLGGVNVVWYYCYRSKNIWSVKCKNNPHYLSFKPACVSLSPHPKAWGIVTSGFVQLEADSNVDTLQQIMWMLVCVCAHVYVSCQAVKSFSLVCAYCV